MDREHKHLQEKTDQLNEVNYRKDQGLDQLAGNILKASREEDDLKHESFRLNDEIKAVEKENSFLLEDQRAFLKRNEQERREGED